MSDWINLKIKIKMPINIGLEELRIENKDLFEKLLKQYQHKAFTKIILDNFDLNIFWLGFVKYINNNLSKN